MQKFTLQEVFQVPKTQVHLRGDIIASGTLKVLNSKETRLSVLVMDQFQQVIPAGQLLQVRLSELSRISIHTTDYELVQELEAGQALINVLQGLVPALTIKVEHQEKSWIIGSSEKLRDGMIIGGKFLGEKLFEFSDYVKGKIDQRPEQANPLIEQGQRLETAKKVSSKLLEYTQMAFGGIYYYGGKALGAAYNAFLTSQKGREIKESEYYQPIKNGALTLTKVAGNLYQGVFQGIYSVGAGTTRGITNVVEKTHGASTAKALEDVFETGGNAVKVVKAPRTELAKHINEEMK